MAFKTNLDTWYWNPNIISQENNPCLHDENYALIVLNHGLDDLNTKQVNHFDRLWNSAKFRLSVDGGTNNLIDLGDSYIPDCISGDFDSIKESTLNHFKKLKVEIIKTIDQDHIDFMKSLFILSEKINSKILKIDYIIVIWQITHRIDQTFANISALYKWYRMVNQCPIFLLDIKGSLSWLLPKGNHEIISNKVSNWCSLVPFAGDTRISSSGLMYNMDKLILSFNVILSTSNKLDKSMDKVTLQVDDKPVLWSQELLV
ncbi:thiamin pyrophosphokinase 1-like [Panonychus citri]|uniref:thiamin pyrophosphokinase 1-like n=1 Tax=Panonychus citri TaxID=50023 RepID=UPI002307B47D|nr:thiamin pyrophosphokinase 1-like [Panonychus citri]XP_053206297.1 thiamin pyrophosphokinase 1-like [Panonychus citri]